MTGLPEPHRSVGIFAGLRSHLLLWGYSPRRFVEQADRWLGQTAVTPIHFWIRSYRRTHILSRVQIAVRNQLTIVADVQATFNTVRVGFHPTFTAGYRRG